MTKVADSDLNQINGGFKEVNKALPTNGLSIKCPNCGATGAGNFAKDVLFDPKMNSVEYSCTCGCKFICYNGYAIKKGAWVDKCNEKGYKYPFA